LLLSVVLVEVHLYTRAVPAGNFPASQEEERVAFGFGLQAFRSDNRSVEIRWDTEMPALRQASQGVLKVSDGEQMVAIPLEASDLARGSLTYMPRSDPLGLELSVQTDAGFLSERIRAVQPQIRTAAAGQPEARNPAHGTVSREAGVDERPQVARPLTPRLPTRGVARDSLLNVAAPVPTRRVQPILSDVLRRTVSRPATIEVTVQVDEKGSVTSVSTPGYSGLSARLAYSAVAAARAWKFRPAIRNGRSVPGEYTMRFTFDRRR
jgi:TonB family protein